MNLPMLGRTKAVMRSVSGAEVRTIVYVVRGQQQSLLGLRDGEALGIIEIKPEGRYEMVGRVTPEYKLPPPGEGEVVSGGQTQAQIDSKLEKIIEGYTSVFEGIGRAKMKPIHIFLKEGVVPVQQKQRPVAFHYKDRLKEHINELSKAGVIEGPLESKDATGWVCNPVITHKKWSDTKIRMNLELRSMKNVVRTTHFPMPTFTELRHNFAGSDRFTSLDMNHAYHQFGLDEESKQLFTFYSPWGLYRYNTLVMGAHTASSECQEAVRLMLVGLEGVQQIQDDVVVHGKGEQHDIRLEAVLKRFQEYNITLRRQKCTFGQTEVLWFGHKYSKQGMSPDPSKTKMIKDWPAPTCKSEVKSFLQTVQFCAVFMKPGPGRTYADVTSPLRKLTAKQVRFKWDDLCQRSFEELKELLWSDTVMANYEVDRRTRVYVDHGPQGVAATLAQEYKVPGQAQPVWRPVNHTSRSMTVAEKNYGKTEGESLAVVHGILTNKSFLYGIDFTVITDHLPLVSLYNSPGRAAPVRVAKHRSKLGAFAFKLMYEPGSTTPCEYGSRHPSPLQQYSREEKDALGIEDMEDEAEFVVNRVVNEAIPDAVTLPVVRHYMEKDSMLKMLLEDVLKGRLRAELHGTSYERVFGELTAVQGVLLRGERMVIPKELQADVLALAHEGHPGMVPMLRQLRQDVWWPVMTKMINEYVATCSVGCGASVARNATPPMTIRETPEKPWEQLACDFKGPIGGKYYFHVTIDLFTRWPEVDVITSTSMKKLYPALLRTFGQHGYPASITHDNGPPYDSKAWRAFSRECGFQDKPCSPEHPEGNGVAERFMGKLVKMTHAALAEKLDPKVEIHKMLLNYRNTPHPSTGKSPSILMMNRKIRTKIPCHITPSKSVIHEEARQMDKKTREKRKEVYDKKKRTQEKEIQSGDKVLLSQKKTTTAPPFDPKPFTVISVSGRQVKAQRGETVRVRNQAKFKLIKDRPQHLKPIHLRHAQDDQKQCTSLQDDYDDDWYDIQPRVYNHLGGHDQPNAGGQERGQDVHAQVEEQHQAEAQDDHQHEVAEVVVVAGAQDHQDEEEQEEVIEDEGLAGELGMPVRPRRNRRIPVRFLDGQGGQLSPQARRRRQGQARNQGRNRLPDGTILCLGGRLRMKPPPGLPPPLQEEAEEGSD